MSYSIKQKGQKTNGAHRALIISAPYTARGAEVATRSSTCAQRGADGVELQ